MSRLWIRADASRGLGAGHVMRTLSLAERAVPAGLDPVYVVTRDPVAEAITARHQVEALLVEHPDDERWLQSLRSGDLCVFDGYHFQAGSMAAAGRRGARVCAIDDLGSGTFPVDVLVNPNPTPTTSYAAPRGSTTLVGPRYALVRTSFLRHRRVREGSTTLVLTLGGTDAAGLLPLTLALLEQHRPFTSVIAVIGPGTRWRSKALPSWLELAVEPEDVASVFDLGDAALSAAGTTTWELLSMGMPLALIQAADNQQVVLEGTCRAGAALRVGLATDVEQDLPTALARLRDPQQRARLTRAALQLVDGSGADRILAALLGIEHRRIDHRSLQPNDCVVSSDDGEAG